MNAALTAELVGRFGREMPTIDPTWQRAFLRIMSAPGMVEVKASYVGSNGVGIVDVLAHKPFIHWVSSVTHDLRDSLPSEKPFKVALVVLSRDLSYEVQYEFENARRWAISKLNGASGMPEGY